MLSIQKIGDRRTAANKKAIKEVQAIMRAQFTGEREFIDNLPLNLFSEARRGARGSLYIARDQEGAVRTAAGPVAGFILYSRLARLNYYYLDYMAAAPGRTGQGIGATLYRYLRDKAKARGAKGIFFECLSDDPAETKDREELRRNIARIRFYARWGARPLANNLYHEKVRPGSNSTLLLMDPLDRPLALPRDEARRVARRIILKKYSDYCPPEYIRRVVDSFRDDPVRFRD